MKLYWFQVAPNPTRVRLCIEEKIAAGTTIEVESVVIKIPKGEQNEPAFLAKNPFGSVPVLELDDGTTIVESLAIIDYLEELYPQPTLWGDTPRSRARARELERIADLRLLAPIARYIHATRSPLGLPPSATIAEQARAQWPRALDYFETVLADGRPFMCGERPRVADCTVASALQFARFAELDLGLDAGYPALARWDRAYRQRAPAAAVLTR